MDSTLPKDTKKQPHAFFCKQLNSVDSIEHLTSCQGILDNFPQLVRVTVHENCNRVFFFMSKHEDERILFAMLSYAFYSVHSEIRHTGIPGELKFQFHRDLHGCTLKYRYRQRWQDFTRGRRVQGQGITFRWVDVTNLLAIPTMPTDQLIIPPKHTDFRPDDTVDWITKGDGGSKR